MEACLYDSSAGFYASGGMAGRRGDFITSPEVGPLFGSVLARYVDSVWEALGRPAGFTVVEAGAGVGTLARAVLSAGPGCLEVGTYVMVERSGTLRSAQPSGERLRSVPELPDGPLVGVILANELLDNLAFGLLEAVGGAWHEVRVGVSDGTFVECLAERFEPPVEVDPVDGARIAVQAAAADWVNDALARLDRGALLVVDYCTTTGGMADRPQEEWLRTYRGHGRGGSPLASPGMQDITVDVAVDQLADGASLSTQAEFLRLHGIDGLVEEGRRTWSERAHLGDLEAVRARSRVTESEALLDTGGLGGFGVLEWSVGC
ncbi:MAG: SAM-dependent methyltransferase [Acidimicrobiales bacterium]|nr:SAM-dependent methyltransferase [Acidimicrobiales bacterium]HBL08965.1 hypothetical protein [Acidimicrobiaceae bacterium]